MSMPDRLAWPSTQPAAVICRRRPRIGWPAAAGAIAAAPCRKATAGPRGAETYRRAPAGGKREKSLILHWPLTVQGRDRGEGHNYTAAPATRRQMSAAKTRPVS